MKNVLFCFSRQDEDETPYMNGKHSPKCHEEGVRKKSNIDSTITDSSTMEDDPRIPLNARQKFVLIKNWKGISREATKTGANMFVK